MYWRWIYAYMAGHRTSTSLWLSDSYTCEFGFVCQWWLLFSSFQCGYIAFNLFFPFPSRTLPRSTRTMTDSGQLRSSISLLGNHAKFLLSRSTSPLNTLQASHALWFLLEEKKTSTNGQNSKVSWHSIVNQSVRIDLPVFGRSAASGQSGWRRDFP